MVDQDEREEEEFAGRVRDYALQAKTLRDILNDAILQIHLLIGTKHWPAEGWDFDTTLSTLKDMLPRRPSEQFEVWAKEDEDD